MTDFGVIKAPDGKRLIELAAEELTHDMTGKPAMMIDFNLSLKIALRDVNARVQFIWTGEKVICPNKRQAAERLDCTRQSIWN